MTTSERTCPPIRALSYADERTPRGAADVSIGKKRVVDQDEVAHPLRSNRPASEVSLKIVCRDELLAGSTVRPDAGGAGGPAAAPSR